MIRVIPVRKVHKVLPEKLVLKVRKVTFGLPVLKVPRVLLVKLVPRVRKV